MHCFHLNRETWSGVLCSETLIRRIWEDLILKATRITCSIRRDQTWRSKSFMSSPSASVSVNYNDRRKGKDWRCRTHNTDLLSPDEKNFYYKKIVYEGTVFRNIRIRNMHDMGEIKRAQEQRIDEVSVQKLRENHETIQQLTSQLEKMQEQMNSMSSPGEFQDIESNYSGRLSHVPSQPEMIPSSRSLLSRDKRLPLDAWNQSGVQENVSGNQFSTFDSSWKIFLKEFHLTTCTEIEKQPSEILW